MNTLSLEKKTLILSQLVEGASVRSIERVTGVHRDTILRLMVSVGERAGEIMDREFVGLTCKRVQADEIWTYVGKKQKNVREDDSPECGDQYVFVAMDAETKLVLAHQVGKRTSTVTLSFIKELQYRIMNRFQLSTDSFKPYFNCVDEVFGTEIDYGQIHKEYKEFSGEKRYSPGKIIGKTITPLIGAPIVAKICTSHIERQNLTIAYIEPSYMWLSF